MKVYSLALVPLLFLTTACNASQVSGTYVAHTSGFTEMLQLTQTPDGQISGVISYVGLMSDGTIKSEQTPVNGTADAGQLTLKFPTILSFIPGKSLAGTISGGTIHLQSMDSQGNVSSEAFERGDPSRFKAYADELKSRGQVIVYNAKLLNVAQQYCSTAANAENWIANAEIYAQRIPNAKAEYGKIESRMNSLLARERQTVDSVTRGQIAVAVMQGDIAGDQVDIQVQQVWDFGIGDPGVRLEKEFTGWDGHCGTDGELRKQGATDQTIAAWESACKQVVTERAKFVPIFRQMDQQRADLRAYQTTAKNHRKALVNEANRIQ